MSLLKTKPNYAPNCVATERGWTNPVTGEVLVAIGMLKTKLELENPTPVIERKVLTKETTKKSLKKNQVLLGEVVEMPVVDGAEVIGE
jgi:hypothetical protein